jgi:hypothetical protein
MTFFRIHFTYMCFKNVHTKSSKFSHIVTYQKDSASKKKFRNQAVESRTRGGVSGFCASQI